MRNYNTSAALAAMVLVNRQTARIFNRVFETRNSTRNEMKSAEMTQQKLQNSSVYYTQISYDRSLREMNGSLTWKTGPEKPASRARNGDWIPGRNALKC